MSLQYNNEKLQRAAALAKSRGVVLPTFRQMREPDKYTPSFIKEKLKRTGLWEIDPANLFRITWKNEPKEADGLYGAVNAIEFPRELTGARARIVALCGKWFPTGAHKVGASYSCLVRRILEGEFDPTAQKAVWPSTGNFCRGGAFNAALLGCESIAVIPSGMSRERFEWLSQVAGETIALPASDSNARAIFDGMAEIERTRPEAVIINQFADMGNHLWHYAVTGPAMEEAVRARMGENDRFAGVCVASGSGGTTGCIDWLKEAFPGSIGVVVEPTQCPTLLSGGFGNHRIEGIGDEHVPWIHNVRNMDMVIDVDDDASLAMVRLCGEQAGVEWLRRGGVSGEMIAKLPYMGISGAANVIAAIKMAKYYELTERDVIVTVLTDSMDLYGSRLEEMRAARGPYGEPQAAADHARYILGAAADEMLELTYPEKKRIHNLKYFTWVGERGKSADELNAQWYDPDYWTRINHSAAEFDKKIDEFNEMTGLL